MFSLYLTGDENKDRDIVLEYAEASLLKGSDVFSFISDLSNVSECSQQGHQDLAGVT